MINLRKKPWDPVWVMKQQKPQKAVQLTTSCLPSGLFYPLNLKSSGNTQNYSKTKEKLHS